MLEGFDFWKLLAGLGIFMFGMFLMEESIKKLSGRAFKRLIRLYTTGKIKSIFSGIFTTSILQSSSAVSLMVLAFVGAGIMTMENAIGVILGSNIGTTVTAWIVATIGFKVNIESFALPLIGTGGLGLIFLGKSIKYSNVSKLLVGFGFLFMGLDYMKTSVEVFANGFDITSIPDYGIIVYLLIGLLLTAIMQSSSATLAIILTTLNAGIISFDSATAMVIGANVGTTVTILLGSIGAVQVKKRVAYSHFAFNMITGILALILLPVLVYIVQIFINTSDNAVIGLALFHTIFNILGVLVFYPLIHVFSKLLTRTFPDRKTALTFYINNATPDIAEAAISSLKNETLHLVRNVQRYNLSLLKVDEHLVFSNYDYSNIEKKQKDLSPDEKYENIKMLQAEIFTFATQVQGHELTEKEPEELSRYLHAARMALHSAKTFKDVKHDFEEFENADNVFLNDQYTHFRKRLIETYLKIDKIVEENGKKDKTKAILKTLKQLRDGDRQFVQLTTQAIGNKLIEDISVSTALIANRAFVQSSRQILLALKELLLTNEEINQFEQVQEISDTILENE
jgi:phosphate:Na+ symporter